MGIPAGFDKTEPGLRLATMLAATEGEDVSGYDRILVLMAYQKMASHYQAKVYGEMAAVFELMEEIDQDPQLAFEAAAAEIRAALRLTRRAADFELDFAVDLCRRLPRVWEALAAGAVDPRRVRVIVQGTAHLPEETAREVVDQIIERSARLTSGQLAALLRRLCLQADPQEAKRRYEEAVSERRVESEPSVEGTANLFGLDLPPDRVAAALRRINQLARSLKRDGETRTIDQLRADVFLDLLQGQSQRIGGDKGTVDIHVDLKTLTELTEDPGELAGYGPVIADIARQVAEQQKNGEWRWTLTHPDSGQTIGNGITRRRPTT
ncbi:MAG: DUF222 domain-containing protein, partial [Acidimicrobiia bacterium]